MKKADFLIIAIILLAAGALALFTITGRQAGSAVVTVDGEERLRLMLDGDEQQYTVQTDEGYNIICAGGGEAWVQLADCPDQVCVGRGHISKSGQTAVCLPHKLVLRIEGRGDGGVDSVTE